MSECIQALFLFDIDGTLLRGSTAVHRDAFRHAYETVYGVPLSLDGVSAAGRTDTWLLAEPLRRYGMADVEIWERMPQAFDAMQDYVEQHMGSLHDKVLPGVTEVLAALDQQGVLLGLLTGNLSRVAMTKMRHAGLAAYFDTGGFGEESEVRGHLVPVAIAKAGTTAGREIAPERTVVIGDTPLDVEAGRQHRTKTVGVATGPFTTEQLQESGADLILPSFDDAVRALEALMDLVQSRRGAPLRKSSGS